MNELREYFNNNNGRLIHKYDHYFDIYARYFEKYRSKEIKILEIGISQGGSLQMWKHYFGSQAIIYGIDIDPRCKDFEEENIEIFIGSQSDREFLKSIKEKIGQVDILIDDGGHTMEQQIITFEMLFDFVKSDGVYLCEDTHTAYWYSFGGGYQRKSNYIEYTKNLIDQLNAYHSRDKSFEVDEFTRTADSIHYYDSVVVIEKKGHPQPPKHLKTGKPSFTSESKEKTLADKIVLGAVVRLNIVLQALNLPGFRIDLMQ